MPTNFQKAKRRVKLQNGNWSDPISYATSSESVELTDGTNLQTKIDNLGTASTKDVATSGDASANQVVMGNDSRLTNARPASDVSAWAKASTKPTYTASEVGAYTTTEVDNKIADTVSQCYHPAGSKTCAELISSLLVSANEGNVYDMSDSGTTTSDFREGAGHPIKAGDNVGIVNVGTIQSPVYKFDLLSGFVDLSAYYTKTESDNKYVAKETGKGLSTNDYTIADKNKLAGIEAGANKTVVDSAMSDSSTNPLQNKVITKELEGTKTATGNPITLTDAAPVNAVNLSMDLEPVQDLHGYDHPWVGGAWKNKLPMTVDILKSLNTGGTWNRNTYSRYNTNFEILTDNDGNFIGIKVTGTPNNEVALILNFTGINNTEYIMNGCPSGGSSSKYRIDTFGSGVSNTPDYGSGATFTASGSSQYVRILISNGYAIPTGGLIFYPMIRLSTETDSSFAPYSNICPISGRSEIDIDRVGKNLAKEIINGYIDSTARKFYTDAGETILFYAIKGKTYKVSSNKTINRGAVAFINTTNIYNNMPVDDLIYIGNNTTSWTATWSGWSLWYITNETWSETETNTQLELGSTATTYQPYKGKTYTIQLGDTVYGGTLDVTKGKMVVDKGFFTLDGSESGWSTDLADGRRRFTNASLPSLGYTQAGRISAISNLFENSPSSAYTSLNNVFILRYVNNQNRIDIMTEVCQDVSTFTTFLSNNPLQVVYELATPITIDLTPEQIKLLENTNTIYTDYEGDTITIEYQPNNAIGEAVRVAEESSMLKGVDYVTAGQKSGSTLGTKATAEGYNTVPSGENSHAEGNSTTASGTSSHAEGYKTCATNYDSHSEGSTTSASGDASHAEGYRTLASGENSHAEGNSTTASSNYSHAEGCYTRATGPTSHAEGYNTTASGDFSHAEGYRTLASGKYSHAEGESTTASSQDSHAEGYNTTASGDFSHAEGYRTLASGKYSHAEGESTTASSQDSHAEGVYTSASGDISHAEGYYSSASSSYSHAEGYDTLASSTAAHAEGTKTSATNYASHSCGHYNAAMTTGGAANNTTGTAFVIGNGVHTSALSNAFSVQYNGVVKAASTITASTTADYAEFFEWSDENSNNEDRVGYFVTVDENEPTKIRIANSNDDYILGIVSGDPFVLGNGDCDVWNGMVMRDDFGRVIYEPAQKYEFNPETGEEEPVYDDEGNPVYEGTKPVYNPEYDPTIPYISRFDRKEWSPVGMLGVLHVRDDGSCKINGYCTVGENGIATKTDSSTQISYKVIARINSNIIKVIFR